MRYGHFSGERRNCQNPRVSQRLGPTPRVGFPVKGIGPFRSAIAKRHEVGACSHAIKDPEQSRNLKEWSRSGLYSLLIMRHSLNLGGLTMGRGILLWLIGVPIPIILLLAMCSHH